VITFPNAKINIGLFITDKRHDGYHNIESIFYPIKITDVLEAGFFDFNSPLLQISGIEIDGNTDSNLVSKAVHLIENYLKNNSKTDKLTTLKSIRFYLHKTIPTGAGLGGGSADGTFALKIINDLLELNLNNSILENMALQLGSDCPFFIQNTPSLVKGRGEILENFELDLREYQLVLVHPGIHISTSIAYSGVSPKKVDFDWNKINVNNISDWQNILSNDFEKNVFIQYPEIEKIKNSFYKHNAVYAQMSGSGSAVYGIFKNETKLESLQEEIKNYPYSTFLCAL